MIASKTKSQAQKGEWIHFKVVKSDASPELFLPNQQFAVVAAGLNG